MIISLTLTGLLMGLANTPQRLGLDHMFVISMLTCSCVFSCSFWDCPGPPSRHLLRTPHQQLRGQNERHDMTWWIKAQNYQNKRVGMRVDMVLINTHSNQHKKVSLRRTQDLQMLSLRVLYHHHELVTITHCHWCYQQGQQQQQHWISWWLHWDRGMGSMWSMRRHIQVAGVVHYFLVDVVKIHLQNLSKTCILTSRKQYVWTGFVK